MRIYVVPNTIFTFVGFETVDIGYMIALVLRFGPCFACLPSVNRRSVHSPAALYSVLVKWRFFPGSEMSFLHAIFACNTMG